MLAQGDRFCDSGCGTSNSGNALQLIDCTVPKRNWMHLNTVRALEPAPIIYDQYLMTEQD